MARHPGLPHAVLATALLMSLAPLPRPADAQARRAQADVCRTDCGWMTFPQFMAEVKDCGARRDLGKCRQHSEGHYTSTSPCQVRIDLSQLGPGSKVSSVEYKGDSSWLFAKQTLTLAVKSGIVVERVKLWRPADQCKAR